MWSNARLWRAIAGLNGFMAIVMGAVSAHTISDSHMAAMAYKASIYQLIHSVVLLWLSSQKGVNFQFARCFVIIGIILFCGTLYLKSLAGWEDATKLAPFGGISLMVGWIAIMVTSLKDK